MSVYTLEYFLNKGTIQRNDAADVEWFHATNSKSKLTEALQSKFIIQCMFCFSFDSILLSVSRRLRYVLHYYPQ